MMTQAEEGPEETVSPIESIQPTPVEAAEPTPVEAQPAPVEATPPARAETPPSAPAEPAPRAAPLTSLVRITWTEYADETVLALEGNGEIPGDRVELVPIASGPPRLVIKISGIERAFQPAVLEVGTAHVQRVRTGLHPGNELHVVGDLAAPGVVERQRSSRGSRMEVRLGAR